MESKWYNKRVSVDDKLIFKIYVETDKITNAGYHLLNEFDQLTKNIFDQLWGLQVRCDSDFTSGAELSSDEFLRKELYDDFLTFRDKFETQIRQYNEIAKFTISFFDDTSPRNCDPEEISVFSEYLNDRLNEIDWNCSDLIRDLKYLEGKLLINNKMAERDCNDALLSDYQEKIINCFLIDSKRLFKLYSGFNKLLNLLIKHESEPNRIRDINIKDLCVLKKCCRYRRPFSHASFGHISVLDYPTEKIESDNSDLVTQNITLQPKTLTTN